MKGCIDHWELSCTLGKNLHNTHVHIPFSSVNMSLADVISLSVPASIPSIHVAIVGRGAYVEKNIKGGAYKFIN